MNTRQADPSSLNKFFNKTQLKELSEKMQQTTTSYYLILIPLQIILTVCKQHTMKYLSVSSHYKMTAQLDTKTSQFCLSNQWLNTACLTIIICYQQLD